MKCNRGIDQNPKTLKDAERNLKCLQNNVVRKQNKDQKKEVKKLF